MYVAWPTLAHKGALSKLGKGEPPTSAGGIIEKGASSLGKFITKMGFLPQDSGLA